MTRESKIENMAYSLAVELMEQSDEVNSEMPTFNQLPRDDYHALAASVAQMVIDHAKRLLRADNNASVQPEYDQNAEWEMNELGRLCSTYASDHPCGICGSTTYAECATRHPFI